MPESVPTVPENQQELPVSEAPRDPLPMRDQEHHEVLHEVPDPDPLLGVGDGVVSGTANSAPSSYGRVEDTQAAI